MFLPRITERGNNLQLLSRREQRVRVSEVNTKMGMALSAEEMAHLLKKMSLGAQVLDKETLNVSIS